MGNRHLVGGDSRGAEFRSDFRRRKENAQNAQRGKKKPEIMDRAAAEGLSSLWRWYEKPVRRGITSSSRPRNSVRSLRLSRPLRLRFRESRIPMDPIGTNTGPGILCREHPRGPFSAPGTNQGRPRPCQADPRIKDQDQDNVGIRSTALGRTSPRRP